MVWYSFLDMLHERLTIGDSASLSSTDWDSLRNAPTLVLGTQPVVGSAAKSTSAVKRRFICVFDGLLFMI